MSNIQTLKNFIKNNQERFLFVFIVILVAIISFKAGIIKEKEEKASDLKIFINNEKGLTAEEKETMALGQAVQRKGLTEEAKENQTGTSDKNREDCFYVGSKNSDKYHTKDCRWSSQIKEENRVCFDSVEDAVSKGYKPAGCCNK